MCLSPALRATEPALAGRTRTEIGRSSWLAPAIASGPTASQAHAPGAVPPSDVQATIPGVSAIPEPTVETVVVKFGGSSVADPEKIKHVAQRLVEARARGVRVVATVSAMGDATDGLLEL